MDISLPARGFLFWPVGTGDNTTVVVDEGLILQVDLHHLAGADDDSDPAVPIVDMLVPLLPKVNGRPYLAGFALTHPDTDHCLGFAELLKRATIGELWLTPRIFAEHKDDLCEDARVFLREARRRVNATIQAGGNAKSGDRLWIIGRAEVLDEPDYKGFPKLRLTVPGNDIIGLDGQRLAGRFRAFIHAPFKDDCDGDRNDSSLGLQISLIEGSVQGQALLLGDLCYPTVNRIFAISQAGDLAWNILLAPHHCSKSVMYWQDDGESEPTLKQKLLDRIEAAAMSPGYIVASCAPIPTVNNPGDNPPHAKAKARYQEVAPDGFMCTMEYPDTTHPEPIIFELTPSGLALTTRTVKAAPRGPDIAAAIAAARGAAEPPKDRVGFGSGSDVQT
jgi:hypothetical protein